MTITAEENKSIGAALAKAGGGGVRANKGPANAVIREASTDEMDRAFADNSGTADREMARATKGPGGKGNVQGIRVGSNEAAGGADIRAAENLRIRRERARGRQTGQSARVPAPVVQAPADTREPWEIEDEPEQEITEFQGTPLAAKLREDDDSDPAPTHRSALPAGSAGDILETARRNALRVLSALPEGMELFVGGKLDATGMSVLMGLGFLMGTGQAVYRGDNHYRISDIGRKAARALGDEQ